MNKYYGVTFNTDNKLTDKDLGDVRSEVSDRLYPDSKHAGDNVEENL